MESLRTTPPSSFVHHYLRKEHQQSSKWTKVKVLLLRLFFPFRKCRLYFLNFKSESDVNYASIAINWVAKVSGYVYHVFWNKQKKIKSFTVYIIVRYFVLMGIHSLCTNFKALLRISDFYRNILYIFNTVRLRLRFVDHSSIWKKTFIQRKIGLARFSAIYFLK